MSIVYILEDNTPILDAEGNRMTWSNYPDATQAISYFGDDVGQYRIVSIVDYALEHGNVKD